MSTPKALPFQRSDKNRSSNDFHENLKALLACSGRRATLPFPPLWTSMGFYHPRPSRNTNNKQWRPFFSAAGRQSELYSRDRAVATSKTCFKLNPTLSVSTQLTKMPLPFRGLPRHFLPISKEWPAVFVVASRQTETTLDRLRDHDVTSRNLELSVLKCVMLLF